MKMQIYCRCGAGAEGDFPEKAVPKFLEIWRQKHSGEGHGECSKPEAVAAYRRNTGDPFDPFHEMP